MSDIIIQLILEGVAVGLVTGSVVVGIAIWRGWIPNFFKRWM